MENCQTQRNSPHSGDHKERFRFELHLKTCDLCSKTGGVCTKVKWRKKTLVTPERKANFFLENKNDSWIMCCWSIRVALLPTIRPAKASHGSQPAQHFL